MFMKAMWKEYGVDVHGNICNICWYILLFDINLFKLIYSFHSRAKGLCDDACFFKGGNSSLCKHISRYVSFIPFYIHCIFPIEISQRTARLTLRNARRLAWSLSWWLFLDNLKTQHLFKIHKQTLTVSWSLYPNGRRKVFWNTSSISLCQMTRWVFIFYLITCLANHLLFSHFDLSKRRASMLFSCTNAPELKRVIFLITPSFMMKLCRRPRRLWTSWKTIWRWVVPGFVTFISLIYLVDNTQENVNNLWHVDIKGIWSIPCHYIDSPVDKPDKWQLKSKVLAFQELPGWHNGENLATTLSKVLDHYDIQDKVSYAVLILCF